MPIPVGFGPNDDDLTPQVQPNLYDLNGDGYADMQSIVSNVDWDGDGLVDGFAELIDSNLDGIIDAQNDFQDVNLDGVIDTVVHHMDTNGDGFADMLTTTQYLDTNGDSIIDTISYARDTNGDGYFDFSSVMQDVNQDGLFDLVVNAQDFLTPDQTAPVYIPSQVGNNTVFNPSVVSDDSVIGDPEESMEIWHAQETDSSCAVAAQEFVLEDLLDQDFTEAELRDFAQNNGWYSSDGTPMQDVGNILEAYGLNVDKHTGGTVDDIKNCLENGGNVIVGVDADEIWYQDNDIFGPGDDANHAVEVIGIDYSDADNPMVILNDSGSPNGCGSMVPMDQFMDAWEDSGFFMVEAYK